MTRRTDNLADRALAALDLTAETMDGQPRSVIEDMAVIRLTEEGTAEPEARKAVEKAWRENYTNWMGA